MEVKKAFTEIISSNKWKCADTICGSGSQLKCTTKYLANLKELIIKYNIKSILDCGCGDLNHVSSLFNFFKENNIKYIGCDIVDLIIDQNRERYPDINFICDDIKNIEICVDLVICREVLYHLPLNHTLDFIEKMKKNNSKYIFTTSFRTDRVNRNIRPGSWFPINLEAEPFNFQNYLEKSDDVMNSNGKWDVYNFLWELNKI